MRSHQVIVGLGVNPWHAQWVDRQRLAWPRAIFFTLRFREPRAYSRGRRGFSALRFLRDWRLAFFRSSGLSFFVFAIPYVPPHCVVRVWLPPDGFRGPLGPLELGIFFNQLLQTEPRELYRNLGMVTLSFSSVHRAFSVFRVLHLLPRTEPRCARGLLDRQLR